MNEATTARAGPKRKRRLLQRRHRERGLLDKRYHKARPTQTCIALWMREAERLVGEYIKTGRKIHLQAFIRHVMGMKQALRCP